MSPKQNFVLTIMSILFLSWMFFYSWIFVIIFFISTTLILLMLQSEEITEINNDKILNRPSPINSDYLIKYRDLAGDESERKITAKTIEKTLGNDLIINAYCHLRKEARTFKVSRIISLADTDTGEVIQNPKVYFSKYITILLIVLTMPFLSCQKDEPFYVAPQEIRPHVDKFYSEAIERGLELPQNIIFVFADTVPCGNHNNAFGCYSEEFGRITINKPRWQNTQSHERKEILVFHELGHAILKRDHDNSILPNGLPKSIMNIIKVPDYSGLSIMNRKYYVDELFNPETIPPDFMVN